MDANREPIKPLALDEFRPTGYLLANDKESSGCVGALQNVEYGRARRRRWAIIEGQGDLARRGISRSRARHTPNRPGYRRG